MPPIQLIITDFDGTLVDTFESNFLAYKEAFLQNSLQLTKESYKKCFGLRFDDFMKAQNIKNIAVKENIKKIKSEIYPNYFSYLRPNNTLISLIKNFRNIEAMAVIASTARRYNVLNVLSYLHLDDLFDLIVAGEDVRNGKPNPEIYLSIMHKINIPPSSTLIFEDSNIGIEAAKSSGANYIKITDKYFIE